MSKKCSESFFKIVTSQMAQTPILATLSHFLNPVPPLKSVNIHYGWSLTWTFSQKYRLYFIWKLLGDISFLDLLSIFISSIIQVPGIQNLFVFLHRGLRAACVCAAVVVLLQPLRKDPVLHKLYLHLISFPEAIVKI